MKKIVLIFLIISFLAGCNQSPDGHDISGKPFYLSSYKGKWLVINYWAKWCSPCLKELPDLNQLYLKHKNKVVVLGVSFDDLPAEEIKAFVDEQHLHFPFLKDFAKEKWKIEALETLPLTLIFSPDHKLIKILKGPQTQETLL